MKPAAYVTTALLLVLLIMQPALAKQHELILADPEIPLEKAWTQKGFGTATDYQRVTIDGMT